MNNPIIYTFPFFTLAGVEKSRQKGDCKVRLLALAMRFRSSQRQSMPLGRMQKGSKASRSSRVISSSAVRV